MTTIWSAATAVTALAGYGVVEGGGGSSMVWPLLVLSRVLMGLASACAMPCVTATVVKWVPPAERAAAIAFVYANFNVGESLISVLGEIAIWG